MRDRTLRNGVLLSLPVSAALWVGGCWNDPEMPEEVEQYVPSLELREVQPAPHVEQKAVSSFDYPRLVKDIKRHEDVREISYDDGEGVRTVGAGFNLEREDARQKIEKLGLDYNAVFRGTQKLELSQIEKLLADDIEMALSDAKSYVGTKDWQELDGGAQEIITNMSYNLGKTKLSKFVKLRRALINEDYVGAAREMKDSRWYNQVGNRGRELVERMSNIKKQN